LPLRFLDAKPNGGHPLTGGVPEVMESDPVRYRPPRHLGVALEDLLHLNSASSPNFGVG
jgi:hypothetical protein